MPELLKTVRQVALAIRAVAAATRDVAFAVTTVIAMFHPTIAVEAPPPAKQVQIIIICQPVAP
jgi:hypothetical protein